MSTAIVLLAHNIRSLWNVGSLFRTADAFKVSRIYLTGYTGTPPRKEITKTAIGSEEWVPWSYESDPLKVCDQLEKAGYSLVGLEQTKQSIPLGKFTAPEKVCLIIGNEILGVSAQLLERCSSVVHIPMKGRKESLNVSVATGIALFSLTHEA